MSNEPLAQNRCGLCIIALYLALLFIVCYFVAKPVYHWFKAQVHQVQETQNFRTEFALKCVRQKGHTISLSKSSVSVMCVGPDGRILSSY